MIVAFDTGLKRTGWVRGEPGGPVRIGSFGVEYEGSLGRMLDAWAREAYPLITGCSHVYFEAPIHPAQAARLDTLRKLYAIAAHVEFLAFHATSDVAEVNVGDVKRVLYGKGGPKPVNACEYAEAWGFPARNDDEADACGVFLAGIEAEFPRAFSGWLTIRRQAPAFARVDKPRKLKRDQTRKEQPRGRQKPEPTLF